MHPSCGKSQDISPLNNTNVAPEISQDIVVSPTTTTIASNSLQALVVSPQRSLESHVLANRPPGEAELFVFWNSTYAFYGTRNYSPEYSKWASISVPRMCAWNDIIKGTVLSISASYLAHATTASSNYREYMSQYGHQNAIKAVRQGVEELTASPGHGAWSRDDFEMLLVSGYLLSIRLQMSIADTIASSYSIEDNISSVSNMGWVWIVYLK